MKKLSSVRHPGRGALAATAIAALATGAAVAVPAQASPLDAERSGRCATSWGSLPEASTARGAAAVKNVRTGRHGCYDRLVIDLAGKRTTGYRVDYVKTVTADGSGAPVRTHGGAVLRIIVNARAYDDAGRPTYRMKNQQEPDRGGGMGSAFAEPAVAGYDTFRQVAWGGSFEGQTTLALGVRARLPFQTHVLTGPGNTTRLVIDVAHYW